MTTTTERQKAIIMLRIYDLFTSSNLPTPHKVKVEQTAEGIIEDLDSEVKDGNN